MFLKMKVNIIPYTDIKKMISKKGISICLSLFFKLTNNAKVHNGTNVEVIYMPVTYDKKIVDKILSTIIGLKFTINL